MICLTYCFDFGISLFPYQHYLFILPFPNKQLSLHPQNTSDLLVSKKLKLKKKKEKKKTRQQFSLSKLKKENEYSENNCAMFICL